MKKTRNHIILSAFSFLITSCLAGNSLAPSFDENARPQEQQFDVALAPTETTTHQKRMRKPSKKTEKPKRGRTYKDMTYEELAIAKDIQKSKNNISVTIKYLEQMMKLCTSITSMADHLLELADLFFVDGQFAKATHLYTQYCVLYPGNDKQEYALYQSIKSSFACILSVDRDQTQTEDTLALTEKFLQQDHFSSYKDEVKQIQTECYQQLAASECNICSFYLTRGRLSAAEKRLKKIRANWLPKLATIEPTIIALETQLAEKQQEIEAVNGTVTTLAHNKKSKHMSDRF